MHTPSPPVIDLSAAPGKREAWDRPLWVVLIWALCEIVLVTNSFQISSRLRVAVLRLFGAEIGNHVIMRPGLRVKFPWKLMVGDRCWIGEQVWIHNQDQVSIGEDVVVSQGSFITTGSHAFRDDMALITRPVTIESGAWVTARCVVLAGSHIGASAVVLPNTVVNGAVPSNVLFGTPNGVVVAQRFAGVPTDTSNDETQAR